MNAIKILSYAFVGLAMSSAHAYDIETHAAITYYAYQNSRLRADVIGGAKLYKDLGIDWMVYQKDGDNLIVLDNPFGSALYYDMQGTGIALRLGNSFEEGVMSRATRSGIDNSPFRVSGWLMRGAVREDDIGKIGPWNIGDDPHDDPYGPIWRVFNHFFDPYNNGRGLTVVGISPGEPTPNWAIGTSDAFGLAAENTGRRNHFTVYDARESMYRALTGKTKYGTDAGEGGAKADYGTRQRYWATMFRALGDVLHLNQDMAQPQHTRNEPHMGITALTLMGNPIYEGYINARATGKEEFDIDGKPRPIKPWLNYDPPFVPQFDRYSAFWSTGLGEDSLSGKGLADYSNHGFFTISNNIGDSNYLHPPPFASMFSREVTDYPADLQQKFKTAYMKGEVVDNYTAQKDSNIRLSRESAWKDFASSGPVYSLDKNNFDDMVNLLIPRAVGYSAGLLNYFFRGQMQISHPDEGVYAIVDHSLPEAFTKDTGGFKKVKLKIKNTTDAIKGQPEVMAPGGALLAVVKFRRNTCYKPALLEGQPGGTIYPIQGTDSPCKSAEEEILLSNPASSTADINSADGQAVTFNFDIAIPINATDVFLQVVFRGQLGNESDAVVAATDDISEPTFYSFANSTNCYVDSKTFSVSNVTGISQSFRNSYNGSGMQITGVDDLPGGAWSRVAILAKNYSLSQQDNWGFTWGGNTTIDQKFGGAPIGGENPTKYGKFRNTASGPLYADRVYGWFFSSDVPDITVEGSFLRDNCPSINATPTKLSFLLFN